MLLGAPALLFPSFTNLIEGAFSEGGECVHSPPRPFRQSSRPGDRAQDHLVGSYPCWLSPSPKPAEGCPLKAAASCSIRRLRNSCRNAWQKAML